MKKVLPSRSRTQNLRRVRTTHYPLRHATIITNIRQYNVEFNTFVPIRQIIQDGAENADVRRNEYHKRSPLSTTGIPRLCVAFS